MEKRSCKRRYCDHCGEYVSRTVYYEHKKDEKRLPWSTRFEFAPEIDTVSEQPFIFNPESSPPEQTALPFDSSAAFELGENEDEADELEGTCQELPVSELPQNDSNGIEVWSDSDDSLCAAEEITQTRHDHNADLVKIYVLFLFLWQSFFRISNTAMVILLKFFRVFLSSLAHVLQSDKLSTIIPKFPETLLQAKKLVKNAADNFTKFVSCPKCHSLYLISDCIVHRGNAKVSALCDYRRFPNHSQRNMREPCKAVLMKTVRSSHRNVFLYPYQIYCYKSPITSLQEMLLRPGFLHHCDFWRKRTCSSDMLMDVYDGRIWKEFLANGFFSSSYCFSLLLNCDWYQPFDHSNYSLGVIYCVIQNLPRSERFKSENIAVVGVIPGPKEPSVTIKTYLEPLVRDLMKLWNGIQVSVNGSTAVIKAALMCVSCDIPATRKIAGFVGHGAIRGCSRCLKSFTCSSFGEKVNYGGFKMEEWEGRNHALHYWFSLKHRDAETLEQRKDIERNFGIRYSPLIHLPYDDAIRFPAIDPMHMLYLGISKYVLKMWLSLNILSDRMMLTIQHRVDSFVTPTTLGRIPNKIASGFSHFSADQWKNWTLYYSLFGLKGLIPYNHYNCWHLYVKICTILCTVKISIADLDRVQSLILEFCTKYEELYGEEYLSMNMHLLCHISDCIRDHGPVYAFWLFPLERMNGILGSYPTNNKDIGPQLMKKLHQSQMSSISSWPEEFKAEYESLLLQCHIPGGSLLQTLNDDDNFVLKIMPPVREHSFSSEKLQQVKQVLSNYNQYHNQAELLRIYKYFSAVTLNGQIFASKESRYTKSSIVFVLRDDAQEIQLAEINYFIECVLVNASGVGDGSEDRSKVILVAVSFFISHPCKVWFGWPTEVWSDMTSSQQTYVPLQSITSVAIYSHSEVNFGSRIGIQRVIVATPMSGRHS